MAAQSAKPRSVWPWVAHHALRVPGGARGEEDVGRVVGRRARPRRASSSACGDRRRRAARKSAHGRWCPRGASPRSTTVCSRCGQVVALEHRDVVVAEEAVDGDQQPGPAGLQEVGRLGALVAGVDRHDHAAGRLQARAARRSTPRCSATRWPPGRPARCPAARKARPACVDRRRPARRTISRTSPSTTASASPKRSAAERTRPGIGAPLEVAADARSPCSATAQPLPDRRSGRRW